MTETVSPSDASYYELVGMVAASWATLDLNFDMTITMLTGMDVEESACIVAQFSSHYPKLRAIAALSEKKGASEATLKELRKFTGSLSDLAERRNRAIHDAWLTNNERIVGRVNVWKEPDYSDHANEFRSLIRATNKRIDAFGKLRIKILNETGALLDKAT